MPDDKDALLQHYRRMRDELLAAIGGLSDAQLSEPSLDGWSVKDHLLHLAFWDDFRAAEVVRISAGQESVLHMTPEQDALLNDLTHALRRSLSPEQAKWELETSRRRLLDAIAAATERGLNRSLYGEAGLHSTHEAEHAGWIRRWRQEKAI
jgi:uncharacterized damage-inducible protein DinB